MALVVVRPGDVNSVPVTGQPSGDARAHAQKPLAAGPRAEANHHLLRNRRLLQPLMAAVLRGLVAHLLGGGAQRQLAQHIQIALAEEIGQRLLHLFRGIDLALTQAGAQFVDGHIHIHHFVGALEEVVRDGLAYDGVGRAVDGVIQRFKVLDVDRGHHVDAGFQQFQHIFVALAIPASRHIGVGQLVDHDGVRMARQNGVQIHLFQVDSAVGDHAFGNDLQVAYTVFGLLASV